MGFCVAAAEEGEGWFVGEAELAEGFGHLFFWGLGLEGLVVVMVGWLLYRGAGMCF